MTHKKPTPTEAAAKIREVAARLGWKIAVNVEDDILTITKRIASTEDFVRADCEYFGILGHARMTTPGSQWGTDGGGMGALHAMKTGVFTMNKSGVDKRILKNLSA
jgi:hypothetical protein